MKNHSKQREVILEVLQSTTSHPTVNWIYEKSRAIIPNISLGTVYRNLAELQKQGMINEIPVGDGLQHFDGDIDEHLHFHCVSCGKIFDCDKVQKTLTEQIEAALDCEVLYTNCVFNGICNACKK